MIGYPQYISIISPQNAVFFAMFSMVKQDTYTVSSHVVPVVANCGYNPVINGIPSGELI